MTVSKALFGHGRKVDSNLIQTLSQFIPSVVMDIHILTTAVFKQYPVLSAFCMDLILDPRKLSHKTDQLRFVVVLLLYVHGKHQYFVHILSPVADNCPSCINGRRNESIWPDWVSNPGPLTHESDALATALRSRHHLFQSMIQCLFKPFPHNEILEYESKYNCHFRL